MRILIITQGVSRIVAPLLNSSHDVVGIVESAPRGIDEYSVSIRSKVKLRELFSSIGIVPASLVSLCKYNQIPYFLMGSRSGHALREWVSALSPDIIVVYSMSQLLKKEIFSLPKFGAINLHPSYLPKYRGPNPNFWQYYFMEMEPGVSVHYIDESEDAGDILYQKKVRLPLGIRSHDKQNILVSEHGITLILKALEVIENGTVDRLPQPKNSPTPRARNISKSEHSQIVKWEEWPIERIWHLMRGTEPWLNCIQQPSGVFKGHRWIISRYEKDFSSKVNMEMHFGQVFKDCTGYFVLCRDGKIRLERSFSLKVILKILARMVFRI
ncbi:methionyl-tRNA formyltransferase [Halomonas lysinitropha]|uniref:Methionyl-tRNA formyltransferase n=1 Tax=Halomonas lysinitropha TaxID=2607506 RepID=A0A5K1I702_9GAMM|nr:formyltransferase family protein [Halomonas lysinitropha]VVZ97076.1 Methionyl-tRNA formyltransferase [Halomonas lysinitropha]